MLSSIRVIKQNPLVKTCLWRVLQGFSLRRAVALCALALCAVFASACGGGGKTVAADLTERDAIEIVDLLWEKKINAEKREETIEGGGKQWRVVVHEGWLNSGDLVLAYRVLQENGLPRPRDIGLEGAAKGNGIVQSESTQRALRMKELKTELERHVRTLPGVVSVNVIVAPAQENSLSVNPPPASASVAVVYKDEKPAFTETQVQQMIGASVPGLHPGKVVVTMAPQRVRQPPEREALVRPRNNMIYAITGGSVTVLAAVFTLLLLQKYRHRKQPVQVPESVNPAAPQTSDAVATSIATRAQSWLDEEAAKGESQTAEPDTAERDVPAPERDR